MQPVQRQGESPARSGRVLVVAGIVSVLLLGAYLVLMPGMDHSGDPMADMDHSSAAGLQELSPLEFEKRLADDEDAFVVNVHVPAADSLVGTDETIPFDEIVDSDRLPDDERSSILLYCESGRMSEKAGRALVEAGYSDVGHLVGGLEAWRRAGLELALPPPLPPPLARSSGRP